MNGTIADLLAGIRRDATYQQTKITDLHAELERRGLLDAPVTRATINGPVTAPACPDCGCAQHTTDCPQAAECVCAKTSTRNCPVHA